MKTLKVILAAITLAIFLTNCSDVGKPNIEKEWDYTGQPVELSVTFFDTRRQLNEFLANNYPQTAEEVHEGFAVMSPNDRVCEVFSVKPSRVDDGNTLTLGHEVLHCLYGRYH